jgi:hypothetical protein
LSGGDNFIEARPRIKAVAHQGIQTLIALSIHQHALFEKE